ncbi:MAG: YkgJ family cysteine cluster protein [Candidatus Bathyarchaeota archaeon]|nr:YkgJ family cysteine cluster protein [Candidatus Termiticorpusculum sp.]
MSYPKNLKFECNKCTLCCGDTKEKTRHIIMLESEVIEIQNQTKINLNEFCFEITYQQPYKFEMIKTHNEKCFFLKQGNCSIYDFRPLICRFYPFELKFDEKQQKYVFTATVECTSLNHGKRLTQAYFKRLFWLAEEKLL